MSRTVTIIYVFHVHSLYNIESTRNYFKSSLSQYLVNLSLKYLKTQTLETTSSKSGESEIFDVIYFFTFVGVGIGGEVRA